MHFLFSNEGTRDALDKVVPLTAGKELFASPGSCREAFSHETCQLLFFSLLIFNQVKLAFAVEN